ncbi:MAG TPA: DUF5305 domain-containing protein [Peptococcaceae bacterium]|nr:DUF5305 domain-containing protein [Peptococcaceae bacterium]
MNIKVLFKSSKGTDIVCLLFFILFLVAFVFALIVWTKPLASEEVVTENSILQKVDYKIKADVNSSTLYPQGGIVIPEGAIFSNITKNINIRMITEFHAEQPISVEGEQSVRIILELKDNWEREFYSSDKVDLKMQDDTDKVIEKDLIINLVPLQSFIKKVEEETKVSGDYLLKIKPQIKGEVINGTNRIPLKDFPELVFSYKTNQILLQPDKKTEERPRFDEPIFFEELIPIQKTITKPQYMSFFGSPILVETVRNYSLILTIFLLMPLVFFLKVRQENKPVLSEAARIDKKHKKRLVTVQEKIRTSQALNMNSFKELLNLADEKDQPIFRYEREDGYVEYFIVSEGYFYGYKADTKVPINKNDQAQKHDITMSSGSGLNV